jgi:hypothetical protein
MNAGGLWVDGKERKCRTGSCAVKDCGRGAAAANARTIPTEIVLEVGAAALDRAAIREDVASALGVSSDAVEVTIADGRMSVKGPRPASVTVQAFENSIRDIAKDPGRAKGGR